MNSHRVLSIFLCFLLVMRVTAEEKREVYVVYMGAIPGGSNANSLKESHFQLLSSVLKRGQHAEKTIVRRYEHGFSGFAARLLKEEALAISKKQGVVSVFADPIYQLHTTRSWEFLQQTLVETYLKQDSGSGSSAGGPADTIIGLLDTGKRAEFVTDTHLSPHVYSVHTSSLGSPRDSVGHGTHTSSTAAGSPVTDASYYDLAPGTAKGGSTSSRIAMYKVCGSSGCPGSALLSGFDDAVADGVDLLSISIGASAFFRPDFSSDPIAIGAFHAVAKGITVVCSAGNDGPEVGTVVNAAPWILTVAATTIDRHFESDIVLGGNNKAVKGEAINFSNLSKTASYPLIAGLSAKSNSSSSDDAAHCEIGSLDGSKIKGKIVLCKHSQSDSSRSSKADDLQSSGAVGAIMADETEQSKITPYISFPVTEISAKAADDIFAYVNSTKNPMATILPSITVEKYKPAPAVAYFSSRGPSAQTSNMLKPDIAAPGVNILASWIPTNESSQIPAGQKPSAFNLISGTSMACPHVAGVAAMIKSWNPSWSPSAVRSAIMTTANLVNNDKAPLSTDSGSVATPYDYGAGEVNPNSALQPGLVYEAGPEDYLQFLCNYGYNTTDIKQIAKTLPDGFHCPKNSSVDLISNLNYPSISISKFRGKESKTVSRIVTNVDEEEGTTYVATVNSPPGLDVKVVPDKLQFTKNVKKLSYQVAFSASSSSLKGDLFGSVTWSDGTHKVRSPFVVSTA
ncbi:uncharacterized protein A4U43_C04F21300 [Asparagus officinalis]|uniref:Subtilisin-like protease n=1 Tax=Asparagus officinalis TaxID=4686 RepID=A0A5P1F7Z7_ASPOF|nr:uncharacterized protein A4U43_C04F21300 [Asparagus officinalis]